MEDFIGAVFQYGPFKNTKKEQCIYRYTLEMDFTCSESSKLFSSYAPEKQSTHSFLLFKTKMQSIFKQ